MKIEYNDEMDILVVEEGDYNDYEDSLELAGFILDLDSESEFLSLEIIDASQKTALTKKQLQKIKSAEVQFEKESEYIRINLTVNLDTGKSVISSQYPRATAA